VGLVGTLRLLCNSSAPHQGTSSSGLEPGPITPGVNCKRRHLQHCQNASPRPMGPGAEAGTTWMDCSDSSNNAAYKHNSAFSRRPSPEFCKFICPQKIEGAGKTGCALHPRSHVQRCTWQKRTRAYRFSGSSPAFPAQWFYSLYRALPGETWLVCHRRPQEARASQELDTCHRGVRTTRLCRTPHALFVKSASASIAPRPNVSDDGQRPLSRDGMAGNKQVIWVWSQG